ncbi:hypothetical protein ACQW5G_02955 [Fructilactobacillus sp. Tb1]|uniref:hypothetical protein n=1 Tax=Fructilactobacillus sp. Tb1 TaxID=3422304 RepID=UPI003D2B7385
MENDSKALLNNTVQVYWVKNNGKSIYMKPYIFQLPEEYRDVVQVGTIVHPEIELRKDFFPEDVAVVTKTYHTEEPDKKYKPIKYISDIKLGNYLDWQEEVNNITPQEHQDTLKAFENILNSSK